MGFGAITKQLAQEALGSQVKELMDTVRPPEGAAPDPDNLAAAVMGQVHAMQAALKDDQELMLSCVAGGAEFRVVEIYAPSPKLLVLTGLDAARAVVRVIAPVDSVQLVCRPAPAKGDAKPLRIRLVAPKPKS
ncbi:MAG: hypothetical protein R2729_05750 [Bryobacteraceae bacterium]